MYFNPPGSNVRLGTTLLAISHHAPFALKDQAVLVSTVILSRACLEATV